MVFACAARLSLCSLLACASNSPTCHRITIICEQQCQPESRTPKMPKTTQFNVCPARADQCKAHESLPIKKIFLIPIKNICTFCDNTKHDAKYKIRRNKDQSRPKNQKNVNPLANHFSFGILMCATFCCCWWPQTESPGLFLTLATATRRGGARTRTMSIRQI